MGDRPFDALLVDLDGVLRRWPDMEDLDLAHDLPAGTLAAAAFAPARLRPAITGDCTDGQWRAAVAADLAATCGPHRAPRSSPTGPRCRARSIRQSPRC